MCVHAGILRLCPGFGGLFSYYHNIQDVSKISGQNSGVSSLFQNKENFINHMSGFLKFFFCFD
jgi:hypothetical protein